MKIIGSDSKKVSDGKFIKKVGGFLKKSGDDNPDMADELGADTKKKKSKKKIIIIAGIVVAVIIVGAIVVPKVIGSSNGSVSASVTYTTSVVTKGDISEALTGSGTLQPANSYEVTSLVSGEILSGDFEEGDTVEEGDILYQIDTADAETSIKSAELNVEKSQLSYNNVLETLANLSVTAPSDGTVTELKVAVGDTVQSGSQIGTIRDSSSMTLQVPFNSADVDSFYVGESATVTLDSTFETLNGTITKISNTEQVLTGNMLVKYVTIEVSNPGGITDTTVATAAIGDVACNSSSTFSYKSIKTITAKASGTVASIPVSEGDFVSKSTVLVKLDSDDIEQNVKNAQISLEDAQNSLENKQEALDDYTIKSPISGTIIEKNYKAGDNLSSSSGGNSTLCTIYDLSYLTMELSVDELDVSQVEVGQTVTVTADAVEGKTFIGTVTKVSVSGTTSNGVTAYPVTVKIEDTEGLLPGMNVDAAIIVSSASDVIKIPVEAVARGNTVLVKKDSSGETTDGQTLTAGKSGIPDGYEYAEVSLGVNDDDYIEVISGLEEGDVIAVVTVNTDNGGTTATVGLGTLTGGGGDFSGGGGMPSGGGGNFSGGGGGGGPMGG